MSDWVGYGVCDGVAGCVSGSMYDGVECGSLLLEL